MSGSGLSKGKRSLAWHREVDNAGVQFSHSLEEQIGGRLEAGFMLLAIYEDTNGEGRLHEMNIPTYLAMRSVKPAGT